ncbi:MAG: transposase family protein [Gammaproteobacteria bacterium]|nr:transposase family protein [Gammaproteobacteria bacterium]
MDPKLFEHILPKDLFTHFSIISIEEVTDSNSGKRIIEIHLDEKNILPLGASVSEYESKGFGKGSRIQDFPIRGKAVYLILRKRRWRDKQGGKQISNSYDLSAQGSRMTDELSVFLKGTGRDPRRYDQ